MTALKGLGEDRGTRCATWCARSRASACARNVSARLTEALDTCRCDRARTLQTDLKDDYSVDRFEDWRRRCALPNLPGSCD